MNTTLHGLTNNEMELGFSEIFTSYETELETHGHVQIGNQLGFVEHQLHASTRVDKVCNGTRV